MQATNDKMTKAVVRSDVPAQAATGTSTAKPRRTKSLAAKPAPVKLKTSTAKSSAMPAKRSRRVDTRKTAILDCALDVFAAYSFHGASLDRIAEQAGTSKTNLLYHFRSKEELYLAVMRRILSMWLMPLAAIETNSDPLEVISNYVRVKLRYSRDFPQASRLFCLEITQGAPLLMGELTGSLRALVDLKAAIIGRWIADGRLAPVDPYHLIFSLWAITQHYADFSVQIDAILGRTLDDPDFMEETVANVVGLITLGLAPRGRHPALGGG